MSTARGFTLIELVVVLIILGVLAAFAVPRFTNLGTAARVASVRAMAGTLTSASENVRVLCKLDPTCDYGNPVQTVSIGGRSPALNYGWLDAGDSLNNLQIDDFVVYAGFTAVLTITTNAGDTTAFTLDGSPDPSNCAARYNDAFFRPDHTRAVSVLTSGC